MAAVRKFTLGQLLMWIFLLVGAFVSVFPFFWMLVGTTLNPNDVVLGVLVPGKEFPLNWEKVTKTYDILTFFFNSMKIALLTVVFGLFVNGLAAFSFEKYRSSARELIFAIMLLTLIVLQMAIVIPMFRQIAFLKLLNTHAAIIMPMIM
jgi:lactose/L-arabinose transport system permease protein